VRSGLDRARGKLVGRPKVGLATRWLYLLPDR
jgi:hypothetical protein